jgi:beta-N-acetylhexosaminidase
VGIDLNFAPVMDVDTNPQNPVIGDRSFSRDAKRVALLGCALISGLQKGGVAACAKHFPGHGDTESDSHTALPRLPHKMERLESVELPPFRAAVRSGVASIMTAHVIFEAVDASVPATMSEPVLTGILRDQLGFSDVVFSDDVEMAAIAKHFGAERAAVEGLRAGVDNFLVCHTAETAERMISALAKAHERGDVSEARLVQAESRVLRLVANYGRVQAKRFDGSVLNCAEHSVLLERLAASSLPSDAIDPTERPRSV